MTDDLPTGYRMTELGPLPQEWQVVRLGDLVERGILVMRNGFPQGEHNETGMGVPHLRPFNIANDGTLDLSQIKFVAPPSDDDPHWLHPGDVIFNNTNSEELVGKTALFNRDGRFVLSNHMTFLRVLEPDQIDPYWLARLLHLFWHLGVYRALCRRHVNQASVSLERLKGIHIPLPPLPEQRAIAHVLRTVQGAKEATERVIAALRELKKSLMRHLFTCGPVPVGDVGAQRRCAPTVPLQETDIGPIPAHWRVVRLGEVAEKPQYGYTTSATDQPVGPKFLRITDIQEGRVLWAAVPYCEIAQSDMERFLLKTGDILVARIGATTGKTFLVTECPPAVFASYLIRVRVLSEGPILPDFLWYYTNTPRYWEQINASKGGRLKQGINIPVLQNLLLPLPPLPEQRAIAEVLRAVDRKIEAEQARRQALEALFKALLHDLMTARRRLPPEFVARFGPPDPSSSQHSQEDVL